MRNRDESSDKPLELNLEFQYQVSRRTKCNLIKDKMHIKQAKTYNL